MTSTPELVDELKILVARHAQNGDPTAHASVLECIQRLTLAVEKPTETLKRIMYQPPTNLALRAAVEYDLIGAIDMSRDGTISAAELAERRGVDEELMVRIMRAVTALGICDECGPQVYSSNVVTKELASPGVSDGVKSIYDITMPAAAHFVESVRSNKNKAPQRPNETPFYLAKSSTVFDWLKDESDQQRRFNHLMSWHRREMLRWYEVFPVMDLSLPASPPNHSAALIVDVCGSEGHDLLEFRDRYPEIPGRLILEDLPEFLESIGDPLKGIEIISYNFFAPQPVIGARVYYFGFICHGWSDAGCIKFLSNTARAMHKDHSRLLIHDYVVPETGASLGAASMDLNMMCLFGGVERTESQWRRMLDWTMLEIVKIHTPESGLESVIETKIRDH